MRVKAKKCVFSQDKVEFLGFEVTDKGVNIREDQTKIIKEWEGPLQTRNEVQRFLGLANWFRKWIPDYAKVAALLTDLLIVPDDVKEKLAKAGKKKPPKALPVQWGEDQEQAFQTVKLLLINPPCLAYPRRDLPFIIGTDAADAGCGAILMQKHEGGRRPIAYAGKRFSPTEKRWPPREQEMFGVIYGLRAFRKYVWGREVTVETDHQSLQYYLNQPLLTKKLRHWLDELAEYRLTMKYVK